MTAKEFAEKINKPYTTVLRWLREGWVPGATPHTIRGVLTFWMIPPSAVKKFKPPLRGRPSKTTAKK